MKPNYRNIVQKGDEIYLCVNGEWFFYNQTEPPLGAGAMGTVYLGRSCQTQERVAIKRVVVKYANVPSIRERAKLEASLLFRHRNLVEMIGYCELNPYNGPIFIVSRLVQGITLDEHVNTHLRNRKDAVKRICESLYPVMDALDYLHQKGIVHMDIKPANIMIEHGSNIRLMDLGIAYTPDSVSMTSPGLIGTPKYAAPEQIIEPGQVQLTVDKTTDIYELGVTLYELLAGYNPFDSSTREETIQRQRMEVLPDIQGVPKAVVDVLRKATEKQQNERFQSSGEFKMALQKALSAPPSPVVPTWLVMVGVGCLVGIIIILLMFAL